MAFGGFLLVSFLLPALCFGRYQNGPDPPPTSSKDATSANEMSIERFIVKNFAICQPPQGWLWVIGRPIAFEPFDCGKSGRRCEAKSACATPEIEFPAGASRNEGTSGYGRRRFKRTSDVSDDDTLECQAVPDACWQKFESEMKAAAQNGQYASTKSDSGAGEQMTQNGRPAVENPSVGKPPSVQPSEQDSDNRSYGGKPSAPPMTYTTPQPTIAPAYQQNPYGTRRRF